MEDIEHLIRPVCLTCAENWSPPTSDEIRIVLRHAGLSGSLAARKLGLGTQGGRTIRRWISRESPIPYAAWALLCDLAGIEKIWQRTT